MEVYDNTVAAANRAFDQIGVRGWIMCHLSHSYHSGACLYFTFAFPLDDADPLTGYDVVKSAIQQSFVDHGGTLSHHHSVGTEHSRWMVEDVSGPGRGHDRRGVQRGRSGPELQPGQGHRELTVALAASGLVLSVRQTHPDLARRRRVAPSSARSG